VTTAYLINMACTTCGLSLMQSPRSAVNRIVFCTECRAGGHYADIVDDGKPLTPEFITIRELDQMLHAMGSEAE
jgi:hypothetical protein